MKLLKTFFALGCLSAMLMLGGCDFLGKSKGLTDIDYSNFSVRPLSIDMNQVAGFAVLENTQASQATKASDENLPDTPYSLYSIDEHGNISMSVFRFEVKMTQNADGDTIAETIQKLYEKAVQVVPYHIHDFGKYLLFSGCSYQIDKKGLSEEEYEYLKFHPDIEFCTWQAVKTFMLRKSDGALFDLSAGGVDAYGNTWQYTKAPYFSYWINEVSGMWYLMNVFDVVLSDDNLHKPQSVEIPAESYTYSPNGHLYTFSGNLLYGFSDSGDAIDVACRTQTLPSIKFFVDNQENVFCSNENYFEVYYAQGGFNTIKIDAQAQEAIHYFDHQQDDKGVNYYFYTTAETGTDMSQIYFRVAAIKDGECQTLLSVIDDWGASAYWAYNDLHSLCEKREAILLQCLGYQNGCFKWFAVDMEQRAEDEILSYNTEKNELTLEPIPANIKEAMASPCDAKILHGSKCYLVKALNTSIQVKEVDVVAHSIRDYSHPVDLTEFVSRSYSINKMQGWPYFNVQGRSNKSGAAISLSINVITGDNTASISPDQRQVVTYMRIN